MSLITIRSPPPLSDFTPLAEHQEKTPESFYDEKPILYYHGVGAKAWISKSQRGKVTFFPADLESAPSAPENSGLSDTSEEYVEQKVDLFVNSQNLTVFCPAAESGLSIPYPQISIHAIKTLNGPDGVKYGSVYLQLELAEGGSDEDFDLIELTLIPPPAATSSPTEVTAPKPETTKLFEAISECSNLNPDPVDGEDDDEEENGGRIIFEGDLETVEGFTGVFTGANDGGLPPALPGSGGWITAENMHEYFDADGNWIDEKPEEELGDGAGAVHRRDEEENSNGNGGQEEGDSKRVRRE